MNSNSNITKKQLFKIEKPKPDDPTLNDVVLNPDTMDIIKETVDFIKRKKEYLSIGAKLPKGILFYGETGVGKTITAKAMAKEFDYNFIAVNGSSFTEKYIGVGAKRVKQLFTVARDNSPCMIFIDEIDSLGAKRTSSDQGGDRECVNTLNAFLAEMDGFNKKDNIIIIGATNRKNVLDEALLRANRFDRHIYISLPNKENRKKLFNLYLSKVKTDGNINSTKLAEMTVNSSGADISNYVNEGAIIAVRNNRQYVKMVDIQQAILVKSVGLKSNVILSDFDKRVTCFHELGHAVISKACEHSSNNSIKKISIIPTDEALGYVLNDSKEDKYMYSEQELRNEIKVLVAGRQAEETFFNEKFSGSSNDLKKGSHLAINIINKYGMDDNIFIIDDEKIDERVKDRAIEILKEEKDIVKKYIEENKYSIREIAKILLEKEELTGEEFNELFLKYKLPTIN